MPQALDRRFWLRHAAVPAALFALVSVALALTEWNAAIARAWAFDGAHGWIGRGAWWAEDLLHDGGRNLVRAIAALCLLSAVLARRGSGLRRTAFYLFGAIAASTLLVGTLKQVTNVDCPWDLAGFGGSRPYLHLFADRPDCLPHAACFPGAHSASGFALIAFYFAFRDRNRRAARWGAALGLATGIAFSIAQEARGAHFLSHDLTSAFLAWCVSLILYAKVLRRDATESSAVLPTGAEARS